MTERVQGTQFQHCPPLTWFQTLLSTFCFWALIDVVLSFPLVRIPVGPGQLEFLLLTEKLHQEAGSGDELGTGQLHTGIRAVHLQSPDNVRNKLSHVVVGDEGPQLLV